MNHLVDIVTTRALRYGLETGPRSDSAARELAELAQGSRRLLELARTRIERGLADRSSRVGERAREALDQALVLVTAGARPMTKCSSEMEARWAGPGS